MRSGTPSRIRCQHCHEKIRLTNSKSFINIYFPTLLLLVVILAAAYFLHLVGDWMLVFIGIVLFEIMEFIFSKAIARHGKFEKPIV